MKRNATAVWNGPGKTGKGTLTTQSGTLSSTPYTYVSRFEDGAGTNPEELLAAAHAGCFTMKLSFLLGAAGFEPARIETVCTIGIENGAISTSHLHVSADVNGLSQEQFDTCVEDSKANCMVSKLYNCNITIESKLQASQVA